MAGGHSRSRTRAERRRLPTRRGAAPVHARPLPATSVSQVVAVVLAASVIALLRLPLDSWGVSWAEDGTTFLRDWSDGSAVNLLKPYAGYLHLLARVATGTAFVLAPLSAYAVATTVASCLVVGALAGVVYVCTQQLVTARSARVVLALLTAAGPGAAYETLGNAANLHWYVLWATPWMLLHRPVSTRGAWALAGVVLIGALTETQVLLFAPLAVLAVRHRRSRLVLAAFALGVVAQVLTVLLSPRVTSSYPRPEAWSLVEGWLLGPVVGMVAGRWREQGQLVQAVGWWFPVVLLTGVILLAAVVLRRGGGRRRVAVVGLILASVVVLTAGVLLNPDPRYDYAAYSAQAWASYAPPRYAVVPTMFLLAVVVLALDGLVAGGRRRAVLAGRAGLAVVVGVLTVNAWPASTARSDRPAWAQELAEASARCTLYPGLRRVRVDMAPTGWYTLLPCDVVGHSDP